MLDGLFQGLDRSFGSDICKLRRGIISLFFVKEWGLARWSPESLMDLCCACVEELSFTMNIPERGRHGGWGSVCGGRSLRSTFLHMSRKGRVQTGSGVGCRSPGLYQPPFSSCWLFLMSPQPPETLVFIVACEFASKQPHSLCKVPL